jgi:hypothetical protein
VGHLSYRFWMETHMSRVRVERQPHFTLLCSSALLGFLFRVGVSPSFRRYGYLHFGDITGKFVVTDCVCSHYLLPASLTSSFFLPRHSLYARHAVLVVQMLRLGRSSVCQALPVSKTRSTEVQRSCRRASFSSSVDPVAAVVVLVHRPSDSARPSQHHHR